MTPTGPLTREDILHLCGDLPDWKIVKIEASEASYEDLETAATWDQGQDDVTLPTLPPAMSRNSDSSAVRRRLASSDETGIV